MFASYRKRERACLFPEFLSNFKFVGAFFDLKYFRDLKKRLKELERYRSVHSEQSPHAGSTPHRDENDVHKV